MKNVRLNTRTRAVGLCILVGCIFLLSACGGSGGGDDEFVGAAIVNISATPDKIDTGDRTRVSVDITNVHSTGTALKIKFPDGLEYVSDSSFLIVDGDELNIGPTVNAPGDGGIYLVYYLSQTLFGDEGEEKGELRLELEAREIVHDGKIEVDPDVDDPNIDNADEFDINNPEFYADDFATIEVQG
jgi:hypothetical protein